MKAKPRVAEQDGETACVQQFAQEVQVGLDDTRAKILRGLLVAMVMLLFVQVGGRQLLYGVEYVEQGVAEQLGEGERTDDEANFSHA